MAKDQSWLRVRPGAVPLVVSVPHAGTTIPEAMKVGLVDRVARLDTDWWVDRLYDFATDFDATIISTAISRTVIDINRDPSGASLYPNQTTTELCPTTTFDGEPLYQPGAAPDPSEIVVRRRRYFEPYHAALAQEIARLRERHRVVVLYDCHSIRSVVPRLFDGELPVFNIGTNSGRSCDAAFERTVSQICDDSPFSHAVNGRFVGGWITRYYGAPRKGVHALQMELACRAYMREPVGRATHDNWPTPYDETFAMPVRDVLHRVLAACLAFALDQ